MPHTRAGAAFTALILETFRCNGLLLAAGDRLTKPLGLTSSRWQVLGAIVDQPRTVAQIARQMGLARQNVQRLADLLAEAGIVEYAENKDHLRSRLVRLTVSGRKTLTSLTRHQESWANRIAAGVPAAEIDHAVRTLQKLRASVSADRVAAKPGQSPRPRTKGRS